MNYQTLLDESIIEAPPPFPSLDGIIATERRRRRARRVGAGVGVAAGMVAVSLAIGTFLGAPADPNPLPQLDSPTTTPSRRTVAEVFQSRLSNVFIDSNFVRDPSAQGATGATGYETTFVRLWLDKTEFTITVFKPISPGPTPTAGVLGRVFGGCDGMWGASPPTGSGDGGCLRQSGPGGSTVTYGNRGNGFHAEAMAVMVTPAGAAVVATVSDIFLSGWVIDGRLAYVVSDLAYLS